jgi:hypothetical protein
MAASASNLTFSVVSPVDTVLFSLGQRIRICGIGSVKRQHEHRGALAGLYY